MKGSVGCTLQHRFMSVHVYFPGVTMLLSLCTWRVHIGVLVLFLSSEHYSYASTEGIPCEQNVTATSELSTLVSPGYPRNYENNLDCVYHIIAPEGKRVHLKTSSIDGIRLETSKFCHKDYILFIDGPTTDGNILTRACNNSLVSVLSGNRYLTLLFHTDSDVNDRGYRFELRAVDQSEECPKQHLDVSDTKYIITSPNFPQSYPLATECEWSLTAPQGYVIYLEVNTSSIENSPNCQKDYIQIRDTFHNIGGDLGEWCGTTRPNPIHSSGIFMNIVFHSDNTTSGPGFKLFYSAQPKSVFSGTSSTTHWQPSRATVPVIMLFVYLYC